jgi:predicted Ser/Thr protein kinase
MTVGDYTLLHRLGEGGMGVVHLAQAPDGRRVALKVLRPHVVGDEEARDRLAREVNSLSRVRSPRVAEILDSDPWGPIPFVATRYVPGLSLHDHVPQEGPLSGDDLVHFGRSLAEALQAVHRVGVLHRDIKPSNVLMEGRTPVLIDFGLARVAEDDRITRTGWLLGTPGYLAPEVLHGHEPTTAADVHAWAATVAFAGTGRPPFGRGPWMAVMDRVRRGEHDLTALGPEVRRLVEAALDPEPARRPTLATLVQSLGGSPTHERIFPAEPPTAPLPGDDQRTVSFDAPTDVQPQHDRPDDGRAPDWPAGWASDWATASAPAEPVTRREAPAMTPASQPYRTPPPAAPLVQRVPAGERLRRWTLGLALLLVVAAGVAAAPYVTAAFLAGAVTLFRWFSVIGSSAAARRHQRGPKWYDAPLTAASTPVDLVASIPGTFLLLCTAAALVTSAALICFALGVLPGQGLPAQGLPGLCLPVLGALLGIVLWCGPGGSRVRGPVRRIGLPLARVPWFWVISLVVLGAVAGGLSWNALEAGVSWLPDDGVPWRAGTWLRPS